MADLKINGLIERKHGEMAAFIVIPASRVASWKVSATTTVECTLDGVELGRRSLLRWDEKRWFIELRRDQLDVVGKSPGDRAKLVLRLASSDLPAELQSLIDSNAVARGQWNARTDAQRRMLREHILTAKTSATRERRARIALLPIAKPRTQRVKGLRSDPQTIIVKVVGRDLPGRTCGPYTDVCVGLALKVGCDPSNVVPADVREARWETTVDVHERDGVPAFRGPAVNGPPQERFLYLTWFGRKGRAAPAMFRRAKLRLDAVPAAVLVAALKSGSLVGRLGLTAPDGMPVCASVRPPEIAWADS